MGYRRRGKGCGRDSDDGVGWKQGQGREREEIKMVIYNNEEKERIRRAEDTALERLDYIVETVPAPDFVEVVGDMGGDTVTYRVYDDGSVYEK